MDLCLIDDVGLRQHYRPYLMKRFTQAGPPMFVALRLLDALEHLRRTQPNLLPRLPAPLSLPEAVTALAIDEANLAAASTGEARLRRYFGSQFLLWCSDTGREPSSVTFEDIDGSFASWLQAHGRTPGPVLAHARRLAKRIAALSGQHRAEGSDSSMGQ